MSATVLPFTPTVEQILGRMAERLDRMNARAIRKDDEDLFSDVEHLRELIEDAQAASVLHSMKASIALREANAHLGAREK